MSEDDGKLKLLEDNRRLSGKPIDDLEVTSRGELKSSQAPIVQIKLDDFARQRFDLFYLG